MKKLTSILIIIAMLSTQITTIFSECIEYSSINSSNNYVLQLELNKLPESLIEDLSYNGITIKVDNNFLEDSNYNYDGSYNWDSKKITLDDASASITHATIHEIGHALDGLYIFYEDEKIIESFNEQEFYFGNDGYYNNDIKEYIAQGIYYYYNNNLDKESKLYKTLDSALNQYN